MVSAHERTVPSERAATRRRALRRVGIVTSLCLGAPAVGSVTFPAAVEAAAPQSYFFCLNGIVLVNNPTVAAMQSTYAQEAYVWLIYELYRWDATLGWQSEGWSPYKYSTIAGNDASLGSLYGYGGPAYVDHGTNQSATQTYFQVARPGSYYALVIWTHADGAWQSSLAIDGQVGTQYCKT